MLDAVTCRLQQLKNGWYVLRHYLKWPYRIHKPSKFDDFNHEHTCIAARFSTVPLTALCPLSRQKGLLPGSYDECETCQYFGTVSYRFDAETGKRHLLFCLDRSVVTLIPPME